MLPEIDSELSGRRERVVYKQCVYFRALLEDLLAADYKLAEIANSFLKKASQFQHYSSYCVRYHR